MFDKRNTPKNKDFNLLHLEWKVEPSRENGHVGVRVTIADSTLKYNRPSLPFLFESLAKQDPDFKEALIRSVDMLNGKSTGIPELDKLSSMLKDILETSKSGK